MPPHIVRRLVKYAVAGWAAGTAAVVAVPLDVVPPPLMPYRVLCEGVGRLCRCVKAGTVIAADYKWSLHGADLDDQEVWNTIHSRSAHRLVALAETNGALYVKWGQGFAAMNHLLPPQYCRVMEKLQDAVLFRPLSEVVAVVEQDLGRPIADVFAEFDEAPLAAASLAQVHRAVVKDSGAEVAVKVQYIDVRHRFRGDMETINLMLKIGGGIFPGFDFGTIVQRTEGIMFAELDFDNEARNCQRCGEDMQREFGSAIVTPSIHWEVTTSRVMVTDFIRGVRVSDAAGIKALGLSTVDVGQLFADAWAYQIFDTGFIHADPHPGNSFVRRNPDKPSQAQLVILDHGLYTSVDADQRAILAKLWTGAAAHDTPLLKAGCRDLGIDESSYALLGSMFLCFPYEAFNPFARRCTADDIEKQRNLVVDHMSGITDLLDHMPAEFALVLRNINTARATFKNLGNPVSRTGRMLRYSLRRHQQCDAAAGGVIALWAALLRLWAQETYNVLLMRFARWADPEAMKVVDDLFALG
jgi:aarF domain-containing kinase